ncbi:MAG: hypothetical protein BMS9Abin15_0070 [Gammaproteobacteria bacterium]|nr:MAG: hypothetical protein BMS9Abin15_0070 [Gammaproteobacteria bacterium]
MSTDNPYSPPQAEVRDQIPSSEAGGMLEDGIAGRYELDIGEIIKESWERTSGLKGPFWGAGVIVLAILMALGFMLGAITGQQPDPVVAIIFQIVIQAVAYLIMVGFVMLGVKRSVDLPISFKMVFGYFAFTVPILIAAALTSVLTMVGMILLIIPGIYLAVAYMLTLPLIVEKKLGVWAAMEASRKAITHKWFQVFGLFLALIVIVLISAIPFGIGLIWTYPMMIAAIGIVYREIFGVEEARATA